MAIGSVIDNIFNKGFQTVQDAGRNLGHVVNNKAINNLSQGVTDPTMYRGLTGAGVRMRAGDTFGEAMKKSFRNSDGTMDLGQVGKSFVGVSAAGRIVSGGGIYKDAEGRTNLIGLPFI